MVGVTNEHANSFWNAGYPKIVARRLNAGNAEITHEIELDDTSNPFFNNCNKLETGTEMYWGMKATRNGTAVSGIWTLDSKNRLYCYHVEEDDDGSGIQGFYKVGNYWWLAHSGDGSVNRSIINSEGSGSARFTYTSFYESAVYGGDGITRKLEGVTVNTEALPSGATVTVKYKKDEETSFTTIKTFNTANALRHSTDAITATGVTLPEFKELTLRVESTGGAVITGLSADVVEVEDDIYG